MSGNGNHFMIDENKEKVSYLGPITCNELLELERYMIDPEKREYYSNIIIKREALEGRDFVIVNEELYNFLFKKYGGLPVPRFTYYKSESDVNTSVEVMLHKVQRDCNKGDGSGWMGGWVIEFLKF